MSAETAATRNKTRRVKDHILDRFIKLATIVEEKGIGQLSDKEVNRYEELTDIFAKSVLPRSQEVSDPEGNALTIQLSQTIANKNGINSSTEPDSSGSPQI